MLEDAGRLNVPFTTGLLIGIGETIAERAESLFALRRIARQYGGDPGGDRAELPGQAGHARCGTSTTSAWRSTWPRSR